MKTAIYEGLALLATIAIVVIAIIIISPVNGLQ